jgi:hypothetical protein
MARLRRQLHEDVHNTGAGDIEQLALFLAPAHQAASDLLQRINELTGHPIGFTASRGIRKHGALEVVR